ncbi:MAG: SUMF1/EgtB/PvdO family nonheme iron enzyme [Candidatus Hydrogenedentes bacterium]|nr:SUMF1/EgtB/PvdO family nonheme iron enzyme [Candidatus Hydrogenedentota bacterium]
MEPNTTHMLQVTCAQCGVTIWAPSTVQGRWSACFGCGARIMAPDLSDSPKLAEVDLAPGARVNERYEIEGRIGKGGFSVVYRAYDHLMKERVALKFMNPRLLRTQKGIKLFTQEAQVCRRLRHENIVAVHDVSATPEGILYLSMEFVEGKSLRAFLRTQREERRYLPIRLVVAIMRQLLSALGYAHQTVIHRDIKPENIMLLAGERIKVLDFGLAKAVEEDEQAEDAGDKPPGKRRKIIGTELYAAPEQKRHHAVDHRADLYACGLLFHELLTLRTPRDEPVRAKDVRKDLSPSLAAVLDKSVDEDKELRWQSAAAFRSAIDEAYEASYMPKAAAVVQSAGGKEVSTQGMVYFEGGAFLMGNNEVREEAPEHEETVEPFYLDTFPVTVRAYGEFLEATGHARPRFWGDPDFSGSDQPVIGVSWYDAMAYAAWCGKDLPSEAQWEFAARGKENRVYPWGNKEPDALLANYGDLMHMPSFEGMHEEGETPEGIQDLAGNVYEWTREWFMPYLAEGSKASREPKTPRRAIRGGAWDSRENELRCSFRQGMFPESQLPNLGFRCVINAQNMAP